MSYKKEFTAEEKSAYNDKKQSDIDEMVKRIDEGVSAVFQSDKYKEYLKFASKFTDYSARNTMLINMQKPDATLVAAYGKWKELGRQVEKGQTGISILAPVAYKTNQVLEIDKPHITTVAEAKKALLDIYSEKKDSVRCEFVHPQTLDEKAIDMFKSLSKSEVESDILYRIRLNTDKNVSADKTHFIQEYIKNDNSDTYAIGRIMAQGTYDECRKSLNELNNPKFEIYQIKGGDEYRDFRFENYEQLTKNNKTVDFNNYDKVYEPSVSILNTDSKNVGDKLESIYQKFNTNHPDDFKGHSLSVSDVVVLDKKAYFVDSFGFKPLKEFAPPIQNKELLADKAVDIQEKSEKSKPKKLKL